MIVDAVRVSCGSDGVVAEDDPLRPPFSPPDPGHKPSEVNPAAEARLHPHNLNEANSTSEARLHSEAQASLIETQQRQDHKTPDNTLSGDTKVRHSRTFILRKIFLKSSINFKIPSWHPQPLLNTLHCPFL